MIRAYIQILSPIIMTLKGLSVYVRFPSGGQVQVVDLSLRSSVGMEESLWLCLYHQLHIVKHLEEKSSSVNYPRTRTVKGSFEFILFLRMPYNWFSESVAPSKAGHKTHGRD